jgi:hypothetical protein
MNPVLALSTVLPTESLQTQLTGRRQAIVNSVFFPVSPRKIGRGSEHVGGLLLSRLLDRQRLHEPPQKLTFSRELDPHALTRARGQGCLANPTGYR